MLKSQRRGNNALPQGVISWLKSSKWLAGQCQEWYLETLKLCSNHSSGKRGNWLTQLNVDNGH